MGGRELFVDEACSGIVSVMSVVACAGMLAVWHGRPLLHMTLLITLGVAFAAIMNVVRISTIAFALDWYGQDWTSGWQHEAIGLCSFLVTFGVLLASDKALLGVVAPVAEEEIPAMRSGKSLVRAWNWLVRFHPFRQPVHPARIAESSMVKGAVRRASPPFARFAFMSALALALGVFHSVALYAHYVSATSDPDLIVQRVIELDRQKVETALLPWRVVSDEFIERDTMAELGRFSKTYQVEHPTSGITATVSIDFPFYRRWHDVGGCYINTGWRQLDRTVVRDRAFPDNRSCQYVEAEYSSETNDYGYLLFANLDETGKLVAPPRDYGDLGYFANVLINKIHHGRQVSLNPRKVFQVQVWHQQPTQHNESLERELEQLFDCAFAHVRRELTHYE